jgi:hypothetical protein
MSAYDPKRTSVAAKVRGYALFARSERRSIHIAMPCGRQARGPITLTNISTGHTVLSKVDLCG